MLKRIFVGAPVLCLAVLYSEVWAGTNLGTILTYDHQVNPSSPPPQNHPTIFNNLGPLKDERRNIYTAIAGWSVEGDNRYVVPKRSSMVLSIGLYDIHMELAQRTR